MSLSGHVARGARPWKRTRHPRSSGSLVPSVDRGWASAADPEHLSATLGTGALQRRLAVLHRDRLRVLDLDLLLVLDAIGFGHRAPPHPAAASWDPLSRIRRLFLVRPCVAKVRAA